MNLKIPATSYNSTFYSHGTQGLCNYIKKYDSNIRIISVLNIHD
jgi:hypothetical protein